jgi:hypothetical protein
MRYLVAFAFAFSIGCGSGGGGSSCCKKCGANSKPCGDSCISLSKSCSKYGGCACHITDDDLDGSEDFADSDGFEEPEGK